MKTLRKKNPKIKKAFSELKTFIPSAIFLIVLVFIIECRSVNRSDASPQTESFKDNRQNSRFQPDLKNRKTVFARKEIDKKEYNVSPETVPVPISPFNFNMQDFFPEEGRKKFVGTQIIYLDCFIDEAGTVNRAEILSGPEPYGFNEAALEVIQRINFHPGKTGGKPIKSRHRVPIAFSLD